VHLNYLDGTVSHHHKDTKVMESRKSKRSLRMALVLGAAVAGTALVGFGGLAAWNAYTENAGNSVAAGTLSHAQTVACLSSVGTVPTSGSGVAGGWCSAAIAVAGENSTWTGTTGTITVANTGNLASTFAVSMPAAPTGSLCGDLTLKVTDPDTGAPGAVYGPTALTATMASTSIYNNAGTPSLSWTGGGTAGTGAGATGNTFTLTIGVSGSYPTDSTDQGTNCSFNLLFTQAA
jgi:hypothetical protein